MNRCAVIGCGWAGGHHLRTVRDSTCAQLVAAVDPDIESRKRVARQYHIPVYGSLQELLTSGTDFETGIVATRPMLHAPQCAALIAEKKNVLCEKPVCRSSGEIARLQQEAQAAGVRFGVVFNQRYGAAVQKARQLLGTDGGAIHLITASMYQHWPLKTGGDITESFLLTDACCHLLDLMTYLCGPVLQIRAVAGKVDSDIYTDICAALLFRNGSVGCLSHSNVGGRLDTQHPFQCVEVHTKNARYQIENQCDRLTVYPHGEQARQIYESSVFERRDYAVSMQLACEDYLRAVAQNEPLAVDISDAVANMQVLETILDSIRS